MTIRCTLLMLVALTCSCSPGDRKTTWLPLTRDRDADYFYTMNKLSRTDEGVVKVWVKTVFTTPRRQKEEDVSYAKNMFMIRCGEKRYKINPGFYFGTDDGMISKTDQDQAQEMTFMMGRSRGEFMAAAQPSQDSYQPIPPGSPAEILSGIVCR